MLRDISWFYKDKAAWLVLFALVSGCSTTGPVMQGMHVLVDQGSGVVVFSLTHDRGKTTVTRGGSGLRFMLQARERSTGERMDWEVESDSLSPFEELEGIEGQVFVIRLNPGVHELLGFERGLDEQLPMTPWKPITFDVQAGTVQYLGNIHLDLTWKPGTVTTYASLPSGAVIPLTRFAWLIDKKDGRISDRLGRDQAVLLEYYPSLKGVQIEKMLLPLGPWLRGSDEVRKE